MLKIQISSKLKRVKWFEQTSKLVIDFFASFSLLPIPFLILLPSHHPTYISNQVYLCEESV